MKYKLMSLILTLTFALAWGSRSIINSLWSTDKGLSAMDYRLSTASLRPLAADEDGERIAPEEALERLRRTYISRLDVKRAMEKRLPKDSRRRFREAIRHLSMAALAYEAKSDFLSAAKFWSEEARIYFLLRQYDNAARCRVNEAIDFYKAGKESSAIKAWGVAAMSYQNAGGFSEAVGCLKDAIALYEGPAHIGMTISLLGELADVYYAARQFREAGEYRERQAFLYGELANTPLLLESLTLAAKCYVQAGDFGSARFCNTRAAALAEKAELWREAAKYYRWAEICSGHEQRTVPGRRFLRVLMDDYRRRCSEMQI